ncbi:bifunctional metallophosphatase/5'-nucleotidase [Flagellimonas hymeniacidonis]|uniref:Bifunctional metallophosphatase/5'-nucleotidase n=1 Tax=Flagellimonas hymeniacidonis TaxID=2603628 RepID=A0A5C8V3B9_9FLAO|nr:metallophosphatase [Flagellimonas hymeniacidonis]TXN35445.1 bifunctional metallophosphatase/5'-nucleotidase [Flagellimonas hymeniacidonis]
MKRREFLTNTAATSALIGLGGLGLNSCSSIGRKHITILHTNDVHSHIDPFPNSHSLYANLGGIARRATLVESIRNENPNTLLFDAGDIFQGTPYFNFYGGELEFKLMSKLNYDAATIGNHDFDNGVDGLLAQVPHASFELLSANYDFSNTVMDGFVKPFKIYQVDGVKIGVYGLGIALDGLVTKRLYKETLYLNPFEIASDMEHKLKEEEQCDLVICLSHLGYDYENPERPSDTQLAQRTHYTNLIIGGHTHTFLDKPDIRTNKNGDSVLINQVGAFGINLGRIDFYFDQDKNASVNGVSISV